jgi:thioredoxin 1
MSTDSPFHALTTLDELDAVLERAQDTPIVLYKHSRICPLSARMQEEVARLDQPSDPPVYRVIIQDARPVSDAIANRLGVRHESPQVLVVYDDAVLHDASHGRISAEDLRTHSTLAAHD